MVEEFASSMSGICTKLRAFLQLVPLRCLFISGCYKLLCKIKGSDVPSCLGVLLARVAILLLKIYLYFPHIEPRKMQMHHVKPWYSY